MIYADAMKILFLDLASHDALIACVDDQKCVASESVHARIGDHELIPMTEKVLKSAEWKFEDLESIACIVGPGGFTSLRVAVTYANVLADQLGVPTAGVHLSDLYLARSQDPEVYWVHSTKKDQLFIRGGQWKEPTLISVEEIRNPKSEIRNWMGELIDEHREKIESDSIDLQPISDVLPELLHAQKYGQELLHPWYGRGW